MKTASAAAAVSFFVGIAVLVAKLGAWQITGSVALYSDALESTVNVLAAAFAWWALRIAAQPPDDDHPWGHAKAEHFSAGAEGALIAIAAISILYEAIPKLFHPQEVEQFGLGAALSVGASIANGLLGWFLIRRGKALSSPALRADGQHVLSDVITTAGVLIGILLARFTGLWILDPLLACVVALHIIRIGWKLVRESVDALMDTAVSLEEQAQLDAIVADVTEQGGGRLSSLKARRAGATLFVEVNLDVPAQATVAASHALCDRIEAGVERIFEGAHTVVHVEPYED